MKHCIISILVSVALIAGCDSYVGSSEHQARLHMADYSGWVSAKADSRDRKIREIGTDVSPLSVAVGSRAFRAL